MPIATSPSLPSPTTFAKMEDRKRPAVSAVDDLAPPSKRQAVNGGSKSRDDAADTKEEAWIEEYQKGAIYRQMLEYKREKTNLEAHLQELEKSSAHHDDHIRVIDAWLLQLLNEIELLVEGSASSSSLSPDPPPSGLAFKESKDFQRHLGDKGKLLKGKIDALFKRLNSLRGQIKPEVAQLESQVKTLLAAQKELHVQIGRLESEKASLSEQYDTAALKVIKAERKLDRARSAQVQKLEQQALAHATARPAGQAEENGESTSEPNGDYEELKAKYHELVATAEKQKKQLEALLSEIKGLQDENATFRAKKESITDEDYARTDVFKQFKAQNEDLIRRLNNMEAINKQLREEAEKLQAERTSFRTQLEIEAQALTLELEDQIQQRDQDLTRIRSARDELFAEVSMRKASQEQERIALAQMKELMEAKDGRIGALESELDRLRPQEDVDMTTPCEEIEALALEDLRQRYLKLSRDFEAINKEMPLLEKSYKKSSSLAHTKVMDFAALEERVAILTAEKSKADQKYFAARRDMDVSKAENRALRVQNGKSSEIISQLKDVEAQNRTLISTLEKQMADLRQSNTSLAADNKRLESSGTEATRRSDAVKAQISDLTNLVKSKDATNISLKEEKMMFEQEVASLKARLGHVTTERDTWKKKKLSNSTEEEELLRNMLVCTVCRDNFKNTILKGCGHMFCNKCVEDRLTNRMRKCPTCNKAFDRSEAMAVHL